MKTPNKAQDNVWKEVRAEMMVKEDRVEMSLHFHADINDLKKRFTLIKGNAVLMNLTNEIKEVMDVVYYPKEKRYMGRWKKRGEQRLSLNFQLQSVAISGSRWRGTQVHLIDVARRVVVINSQNREIDFKHPHLFNVVRDKSVKQGKIRGYLLPSKPLTLNWKLEREVREKESVLSSQSFSHCRVDHGLARVETRLVLGVSQGKVNGLEFSIPEAYEVTAVNANDVYSWKLQSTQKQKVLKVMFSKAQQGNFQMQIQMERELDKFPMAFSLKGIRPLKSVRHHGIVSISAAKGLSLKIREAKRLTQINHHSQSSIKSGSQNLEQHFAYRHPSDSYEITLSVDNRKSVFDLESFHILSLSPDKSRMESELRLDIREAPMSEVSFTIPEGYSLLELQGEGIRADAYESHSDKGKATRIRVPFTKPILGKMLIEIAIENDRVNLDVRQTLTGMRVNGARHHRGALVLTLGEEVLWQAAKVHRLNQVGMSSLGRRIAAGNEAYKFRRDDWHLVGTIKTRPSEVQLESIKLFSLRESRFEVMEIHNYHITGSPISRLDFRVPQNIPHLELIGSEVKNWTRDGELLKVQLNRKVIGDYSFGYRYYLSQNKREKQSIGGTRALGVGVQKGVILLTSPLDMWVDVLASQGLDEIKRDDIPPAYRLLTQEMWLKGFKYHENNHQLELMVKSRVRALVADGWVELAQYESQVDSAGDQHIDVLTKVMYHIKNVGQQYFAFKLPTGAKIWSLHSGHDLKQGLKKITALEDGDWIKVPLSQNTTAPMRVSVTYGQQLSHSNSSQKIQLESPQTAFKTSFSTWKVNVMGDHAIKTTETHGQGSTIELALSKIITVWEKELSHWTRNGSSAGWGLGIICLGILILIALKPTLKYHVLSILMLGLCAIQIWVCLQSTREDVQLVPNSWSFREVLQLEANHPMRIAFEMPEKWMVFFDFTTLAWASALAMLFLCGAIWHRGKRIHHLLVLSSLLLWAVSLVPWSYYLWLHVLTWGIPSFFLYRLLSGLWAKPVMRMGLRVATLFALGMILVLFENAELVASEKIRVPVKQTSFITLNEYHGSMSIAKDHIEMRVDFKVDAKRGERLLLAKLPTTILNLNLPAGVELKRQGNDHLLFFHKNGRHDLKAKFIHPVMRAGRDGPSEMKMTLPFALSKSLKIHHPFKGVSFGARDVLSLSQKVVANQTRASLWLFPDQSLSLKWQARKRQRKEEKLLFHSTHLHAWKLTKGMILGQHGVGIKVTQGVMSKLELKIPIQSSVIDVNGKGVNSWHFDSNKGALFLSWKTERSGDCFFHYTTQKRVEKWPYEAEMKSYEIVGSKSQKNFTALIKAEELSYEFPAQLSFLPQKDFVELMPREAVPWYRSWGKGFYRAFSHQGNRKNIVVKLHEIHPELRSEIIASLSVGDERFLFTGQLTIDILRMGVFHVDVMKAPEYEVDAVSLPGLSHWEELKGGNVLRLHFLRKTLGKVPLSFSFSRHVLSLPKHLEFPRLEIEGQVRHSGIMSIQSMRGIQLHLSQKRGVIEITDDQKKNNAKVQHFKILGSDWQVACEIQKLKPRVKAKSLHLVHLDEGKAKHELRIRYQFNEAGVKHLSLKLPKVASAVVFQGVGIVSQRLIAGTWELQLAKKWFDKAYRLRVLYETPILKDQGKYTWHPVGLVGIDQWQGFLGLSASQHLEVRRGALSGTLTRSDAKSLPSDLFSKSSKDLIQVYRSSAFSDKGDWELFSLPSASPLKAEVREMKLSTVLNRGERFLNFIDLKLVISGMEYLSLELPPNSNLASLKVDESHRIPSIDSDGKRLLIPLPQVNQGEKFVRIEIVYDHRQSGFWNRPEKVITGPKFDLPLKNSTWKIYCPETHVYSDFSGQLDLVEGKARGRIVHHDRNRFEKDHLRRQKLEYRKAISYQKHSEKMVRMGKQLEARVALENAYRLSHMDPSLNEDARVQWQRLLKDQAYVGLYLLRDNQKSRNGDSGGDVWTGQGVSLEECRFSANDAQRIRSSLNIDDNRNFSLLSRHLIDMQDKTRASRAQLSLEMPLDGKEFEFKRSLSFDSTKPMELKFVAATPLTFASQGWKTLILIVIGVYVLSYLSKIIRPKKSVGKHLMRQD